MREKNFVRLNQFRIVEFINRRRIKKLSNQVNQHASLSNEERPIAFFNASTRMHYLSQNAAFSLLTSWGLSLEGKKIIHFVCHSGMKKCVLGTNTDNINEPPPCEACIAQSNRLFVNSDTCEFDYSENTKIENEIENYSLDKLINFQYNSLPFGEIVLPSMRWILRRHNLIEDNATLTLFRSYLLSAINVGEKFKLFLDNKNPSHLILFNGQMYPEAVAKLIAKKNGVDVIMHEVGLAPQTGFFTRGEATAYPLPIPNEYILSKSENNKLDEYLSNRFKGNFSMAGINFWNGIQSLNDEIINKINLFKQLVPIFTNVIFDTSQNHANTLFDNMFTWLKLLIPIIENNPETLFVLRAHPDESRKGKSSKESVADFVRNTKLEELENVLFIDSDENLSSYELILKSKFILVYNSSIGLEGTILGKPVLSAGKARYTQYPIVTYPSQPDKYFEILNQWLSEIIIPIDDDFIVNARKFLFFQLFKSSLPFSECLSQHKLPGYVYLKKFNIKQLKKENSIAIDTILNGIDQHGSFLYEKEEND